MKRRRNSLITEHFKHPNLDHTYAAASEQNDSHTQRDEIRAQLELVFDELDLSTFPNISPNAPADVLANYVIDNPKLFGKKELEKPVETMEHTLVNLVNSSQRVINGNLLEAFMNHFHEFFEAESQSRDQLIFDKPTSQQLLHQEFLFCRTLLIEHLVEEFNGRYSTAASICFFVESNYANLVRKYFLHVEDSTWNAMISLMPIPRKRRKTWIDVPSSGAVYDSYTKFHRFFSESKRDYNAVFEGDRLSKNAETVALKEKTFTCGVCFDEFSLNSAILCSFPEVIDLLPKEQEACTSKSVDQNDENTGPHTFCLECVRGQAVAATTDMPLAEGGVGLKCMAPNCGNPILFSKCRSLIPYRIRKILNERIWEENLGMAKLENLERCKRCNYAIDFEASKDVVKVFNCQKCAHKTCRVCDRDWDDKHFGKPCAELDKEEKVDIEARKVLNQMSETAIRKCHKCGLAFVKWDGCNKIHCRCGATQCYVCRAPSINYKHFCEHFRQPGQKSCTKCKKKCLLWENVDVRITAEVEKIRADALKNGITVNPG